MSGDPRLSSTATGAPSPTGVLSELAAPLHLAGAVDLDAIRYRDDGLVTAVVQDGATREVLMVGYMDEEAVRRTVETGRSWFWSRSRSEYWCKGETSGDRQIVQRVAVDCDGDALLVTVNQLGRGACHTGERSCFYRTLAGL